MKYIGLFVLFVGLTAQVPPFVSSAPESVTITASADGTKPFVYQWFRNGVEIEGETAAEMIITDPKATGVYFCRISNSAGSTDTPTVRLGNTSQDSMADYTLIRKSK